ncbi:PREDICTED: snaclec bothroinsularin subunit beta-like [Branchiostoma belcheri]|uniref:Snaclec bothroinsularin subunit beta-like n=1 Tax=Branchiostoma belcheri TaxID=7741 RepID=A0A6P5A092_BRABE|nr:PREDICTED: snaclec bothroinsularin subunit beta-like [Branchiostoma belcheri]
MATTTTLATTPVATTTSMATTTTLTTTPVATTTTMATTTPMTTTPTVTSGPCLPDYELFEDNCYRVFTEPKSYMESVLVCKKDCGVLATPRTSTINNYLVKLKNRVAGDKFVRFGLTDHVKEGVFEWIDGTPLGDFTNWELLGGKIRNSDRKDCVEYNKLCEQSQEVGRLRG